MRSLSRVAPRSIFFLLTLAMSLPSSLAFAQGGTPLPGHARTLEIFPGGNLTLRFPDGDAPSQPVLDLASAGGDVRLLEGTTDSQGNVHVVLRCHFIGEGTAKLFDLAQPPTLQPIRELSVRCSWPTPPEAAAAPSAQLLAATAAPEPSAPVPPGIPGRANAYETRGSSSSNETETVERADGEKATRTKTVSNFSREVFANGELCSETVESGQSCCNSVDGSAHGTLGGLGTSDCSNEGCFPLIPLNFFFCQQRPDLPSVITAVATVGQTETREKTTSTFSPPASSLMNIVREYRLTSNGVGSMDVNWSFPGVEADQQIDEVQIYARALDGGVFDGAVVRGSIAALPMNGVGPAATLGPPVDFGSTPTCPFQLFPELQWSFESPPAGNEFSILLAPSSPTCSFLFQSNQTIGGQPTSVIERTETDASTNLSAGIRARTARKSLSLEPADLIVAPSRRRSGNFNVLGNSRTVVRARLAGVPASTYRVDLRVDAFDAGTGGHAHDQGTPPTGVWGRVAIDPQDFESTPSQTAPPSEDSCDIVVDETGEGICDFFFQADEVSGRATFKATSLVGLETKEGTTTVDVHVRGLIDVRSLIGGLGGLFRNPDVRHTDDNAFYMSGIGAAKLMVMLELFQRLTTTPGQPQGLALLLNDASLPRGGLFDIEGDWTHPHRRHRQGLSADINREGVLTNTLPNNGPRVAIEPFIVETACNQAQGRIIPEPTIHCEF